MSFGGDDFLSCFSPNMLCSWFDLVRFASAYFVTIAGFVGDQSM